MTPALNMTTSAMSSMSSLSGWGSIFLVLIIVCIALSFLMFAFSNIQRFKKLKKIFLFLGNSFKYFGWGCLSIFVLTIPSVVIYYFVKEAGQGNYIPLKWIGYIIGGYVIISFIGYIIKKYLIDRIKNLTKQEQGGKRK